MISGKLYEYLAARRPILGVVPEDGGDAWLLGRTGAGRVTGCQDPEAVAGEMLRLWRLWKEGRLRVESDENEISSFAWPRLTAQLAGLLGEAVSRERTRSRESAHQSN